MICTNKEKKNREVLKNKLRKYKNEWHKVDQENQNINFEKDQAILKIKNSFMCKLSPQI